MRSKQSVLFESPTVRIVDYQCNERPNSTSCIEVSEHVEMTYTRTGHFLYRGYRQEVAIDNTLLLLKNEGSEHRITHDAVVRDTCTAFQFSKSLLENYSFPVSAVPVTPRWDYLHAEIFDSLTRRRTESLKIDVLSTHLLEETFRLLSGRRRYDTTEDTGKIRTRHRDAIERAKLFILENFTRDLSLKEIARNAYISEFHFSRIFRAVTCRSPHRFLLDVRFHHAELLLRETFLPVTQICYSSGFNNLPHFIAAFTQRHRISPLQYRKKKPSKK